MNENLIPQSERTKDEQRRIARMGGKASGRVRKERAQRLKDLLALFNVEPLTSEVMKQADSVLLAMTAAQLKTFAENEKMPTYMRRRARLLLQQDDERAFDTSEKMLDRAFGKPKQAVDVDGVVPIIQVIATE